MARRVYGGPTIPRSLLVRGGPARLRSLRAMTETIGSGRSTSTPGRVVDVPDKPALEGLEARWSQAWKDQRTYAFDRTKERDEIYSIDTPPPTVSGSLHVGHVFSYTHTDLVARFQRM